MEYVTDTQLNRIDSGLAYSEKMKLTTTPVSTRVLRDLLRELRRLRDRESATSGTEAK